MGRCAVVKALFMYLHVSTATSKQLHISCTTILRFLHDCVRQPFVFYVFILCFSPVLSASNKGELDDSNEGIFSQNLFCTLSLEKYRKRSLNQSLFRQAWQISLLTEWRSLFKSRCRFNTSVTDACVPNKKRLRLIYGGYLYTAFHRL